MACVSVEVSPRARRIPIRPGRTIARRPRCGSCAKARSASARAKLAIGGEFGRRAPLRRDAAAPARPAQAHAVLGRAPQLRLLRSRHDAERAATGATEKLVLNTPAIAASANASCRPATDTDDPDVSPLYADLRGMPAALFSVGTRDSLLDDYAVHGAALARGRQRRRARALSRRLPRLRQHADSRSATTRSRGWRVLGAAHVGARSSSA